MAEDVARILLAEDNCDFREILASLISSQLPKCKVVQVTNGQEAIDILKEQKDFSYIFCDYNMPLKNGGEVFEYLKTVNSDIPFVLISSDALEDHPEFSGYDVEQVTKPDVVGPVMSILARLDSTEASFHPLRISHINTLGKIDCDLYLKMSHIKFLKVIKKGSNFCESELSHYKSKGVEYLYIKQDDVSQFFEKLVVEVLGLEKTTFDDRVLIHEVLNEAIRALGVTEEVQKLTEMAVENALKSIEECPDIDAFLHGMKVDESSYISSHSTALAHLACLLVSKLSWSSELAFKKLSLAAILHDVCVENDELAQVETLEELEKLAGKYTSTQLVDYRTHPELAAELVSSFSGKLFPPDVANIVLHHHELPDGSGFPNGLKVNDLSVLSAVFILSHDLLNYLVSHNYKLNLSAYLTDVRTRLRRGPFTDILQELDKLA